MSDLFKSFTFDIQRFGSIKLSEIKAGGDSTKKAGDYWGVKGEGYFSKKVIDGTGTATVYATKGTSSAKKGTHTLWSNPTKLVLTGKGTQNFTISSVSAPSLAITNLDSVTLKLTAAGGSTIQGLTFKNAGSNDKVQWSDGGFSSISLKTKGASLTVSRKDNEKNDWLGDYKVNGKSLSVAGTGFTFTVGKKSTLSVDTDGASIVSASAAAYVVPGSNKIKSLLFGSTGTGFNFTTAGGLAFGLSSTGDKVQSVNFSTKGDALALMGGASALAAGGSFTYGSKFKPFASGLSIAIGKDNENAVLTLTDNASAFEVSGMAGGDSIKLGKATKYVQFLTSYGDEKEIEAGGKIAFDAKSAAVSNITADVGAVVGLSGFGKSEFSINGSKIQIEALSGTGKGTVTSALVQYAYLDKDTKILDLTKDANASTIKASALGDATQLNLNSTVSSAVIGKSTFNLSMTGMSSAFVLDGKSNATGFIFNAFEVGSGSSRIIFDKGLPDKFSFYESDPTDDPIEVLPTITGTGAVAVGLSAAGGENTYTLDVGTGLKLSFANGTKIDFTGMKKNDYADIVMDEDGAVTNIIGANVESDETLANAIKEGSFDGTFSEGTTITVTGAKATAAEEGIIFGGTATPGSASTAVALASGNFVYTYGSGDSVQTSITLTDSNDTVYGIAGAEQVKLGNKSGTITDATTGEEVEFKYKTGGNAYFAADGEGALTGFAFYDEGDALSFTGGLPEEFGALYYDASIKAVADEPAAVPTITAEETEITLTMIQQKKGDKKLAQFEISGLSAESQVAFESGSLIYSDGGTALFGETGTALGFTAEKGTVTISSELTSALAPESEDADLFTINGKGVNIAAEGVSENGLVYNAEEKSLFGLGDGTAIVEAGEIERIYAAKADDGAEYIFGKGDDTISYKASAASEDATEAAYFALKDSKVTGFVFMAEDDFIILDETADKAFTLQDGAEGTAFTAPIVYEDDTKAARAESKIVKTETRFEVVGLAEGNYVEFADTGTALTFQAINGEEAGFAFDATGALAGVVGLAEGDAVKVDGATGAIAFGDEGEEEYVEIIGKTASFVYEISEDGTPAIKDVYGNSTIKQVAGATQLFSASGANGIGAFTFGTGASATAFTVAGEDKNGIIFELEEGTVNVSGISDVDAGASVTGAFFGNEEFNFNGEMTGLVAGASKSEYTFSGASLFGLKNGDEVVTAGGISDFITAEEGVFTIIESDVAVVGDDEVEFQVTDEALTGIDSLDAGAMAIGEFEEIKVNGQSIAITGDEGVMEITGAEVGIAKIGGLSGDAVVIDAVGNATQLGADGDGTFTFNFLKEGAEYTIEGNSAIETTFTLGEEFAVDGLDDGEAITGSFSAGVKVEGKAVQVTDEDGITITSTSGVLSISKLSGGASLAKADDIFSAKTDSEGEFTFVNGSFNVEGDDEVEFVLDGAGNVVGISGVDDEAVITGDLNGIWINKEEPVIEVIDKDGNPSTKLVYKNGTLSGIYDGDTIIKADNVDVVKTAESGTFTFGEGGAEFTVEGDDNGVEFQVKTGTIEVIGVNDLDEGATLRGAIGGLTVNGASVIINNDDDFAVVGAAEGISQIIELSDGAEVVAAGGALSAVTDTDGEFTFANGTFRTYQDSEVAFELDGEAVAGVAGLSGMVSGKLGGIKVNGEDFEIEGDSDEIFAIAGKSDESAISAIGAVGGQSVTIKNVGSASAIFTNEAGKFTFETSGQEFTTDDDEIGFVLENGTVAGISGLEKSVTGDFTDVTVNNIEFSVTDANNELKVIGTENADGISEIADVTGDATITDVGGAQFVSTDSDGEFAFAGHSNPFTIEGDSAVTFEMVEGEAALVKGITNFGDEGAATIKGELGKVAVEGVEIDIEGDDDELFSYAKDASGNAVLGEVGGASVVIKGIGGASKVEVISDGSYTFSSTYVLSGGNELVTFGASSVEGLTGTIEGDFESATVNGKKIAIAGDSQIGLVGGESGVAGIFNLSDKAIINAADDVFTATTDGDGTFTFADGREIGIAGSASGVEFALDGKGNLVAINGVDENTTVTGDLNGLTFGGEDVIDVQDNVNLWYNNGTLSGVVAGDTVVSADGATLVVAQAEDGLYNFGSGSTAQSFKLTGDSGIIAFEIEDGNKVVGISELDPGAMVEGKLNGIAINGGESIDIVGDTDETFGVMAGEDGIVAVGGVGGLSVTINNVGSASFVFTEGSLGQYTFTKSDQTFEVLTDVGGEHDGVGFMLKDDKVIAIGGLSGLVEGDFQEEIEVNGQAVQVEGDNDGVLVGGDDDGLVLIDDVDAGATVKAWGDAAIIGTDGEGEFTFDNGELPAQKFTVGGDSDIAFITTAGLSGAPVAIAGVSSLENGTLKFDTVTSMIGVNFPVNDLLTFDTTEDVTLTIVDSKVVGLSGITGGVSGVGDATVEATGPITVNGEFVDITDADSSFDVVVASGSVSKITDVTGDATVNVVSGEIETDETGKFLVGGEEWTFADEDGEISMFTDADKKLIGVNSLSGTVEFAAESAALLINGDAFAVASASTSDPAVKVTTDGEDITAVDGLESGDSVSGDLDKAEIAMVGSSATVKGEGSFLTINDNEYQLLGDADGIIFDGENKVVGLDENASLIVGNGGDYNVNGVTADLEDLEPGTTIVGGNAEKTDAYVYDPEAILVRKGTPIEEIENMLGMPNYDDAEFGGPRDGVDPEPLTKEESDALFDPEDPADLDQPAEFWIDNKDNKETQELDLSGTEFAKKVTLYEGPQAVKTNDEFGNEIIVDDEATGQKDIELGDGGNAVIVDGAAAIDNAVDITGGAGNDSVFVRDDVAVTFDMSEGGADLIITWGGANARVKLEGYDYSTGAGIKIDERKAKDIAQAIANGLISFGDGVVSIMSATGTSIIDIGSKLGGTLVNLFTPKGTKQVVGFTGSEGGQVGDEDATDDLILIGNKGGKKSGSSTLTGGIGNDTAFAGAGDEVDLGDGNNVVELDKDDNRAGAKIVLGEGFTTINNMNNTLNEKHGDKLVVDLTKADVSFDGTNLIIEGEDFYAIAPDADKNGSLDYSKSDSSSDLSSSADEAVADLVVNNNYTNQIIESDGATWKGSFGADGAVMQVEADEDIRANYYKGTNAGVTFAGYDDHEAIVDLANDGEWVASSSIDGRAAVFDGVVSLKAGAGRSHDQFKGSDNNETLMGGQGYASLYGDGGNNLLVGYNGTDGEKEGQTTFLVLGNAAGAANTITGFEYVSDDNYTDTEKVTADILEVDLNTNHVERIDISGDNDVLIEVKNNNNDNVEKALIVGAVGEDICLSDLRSNSSIVAQVNTDKLEFDKYASYYYATEKNATLTVDDANIQDNAFVYLGGTEDASKYNEFVGDFRVIDATNFSGKAELAGNFLNNTIIAGSGETSLWGGQVGDDVLYGGKGKDTFFYAYGNGTDTVYGAEEGDVVNLSLNLADIADAVSGMEEDKVAIKFTDGGSLTVNGDVSKVAFKVEGETYYADVENKAWNTKKA